MALSRPRSVSVRQASKRAWSSVGAVPVWMRPCCEVGVDGGVVAGAQLEGGVGFPGLGEAADGGQFRERRVRSVASMWNAPPASMAPSWAQSPTSRTFASTARADSTMVSRARVPARLASSMMTSCPGWIAHRSHSAWIGIELGVEAAGEDGAGAAGLALDPVVQCGDAVEAVGLRACFVQPFGGVLGARCRARRRAPGLRPRRVRGR